MCGEQHAAPALDERAYLAPEGAAAVYIEPDGGLIEKQKIGIAADSEGKENALLLSSGELAEGAIFESINTGLFYDGGQRQRIGIVAGK